MQWCIMCLGPGVERMASKWRRVWVCVMSGPLLWSPEVGVGRRRLSVHWRHYFPIQCARRRAARSAPAPAGNRIRPCLTLLLAPPLLFLLSSSALIQFFQHSRDLLPFAVKDDSHLLALRPHTYIRDPQPDPNTQSRTTGTEALPILSRNTSLCFFVSSIPYADDAERSTCRTVDLRVK